MKTLQIIDFLFLFTAVSVALYFIIIAKKEEALNSVLKSQNDNLLDQLSIKNLDLQAKEANLNASKDNMELVSRKLAGIKNIAERLQLENTELDQRLKFQKEINKELKSKNTDLEIDLDNLSHKISMIEKNNEAYGALSSLSDVMKTALTGQEPISLSQLSDKTILQESIIKPILNAIHAKDTTNTNKLRNISLIIDTAIDTIKED